MDLKQIVEALLIAAPKPLSETEIRDVLRRAADDEAASSEARALKSTAPEVLHELLTALAAETETAGRSYRLVCVAGAWQFVTLTDYAPWVRMLLGAKSRPPRLTQPALETLAVIAYRQPVTRAEIEQIRGVAVDGVIATLKERNLIMEAGRAEVVGRPVQFATTGVFLEYFGLGTLADLPAADELRRLPVARPAAPLTADAQIPLPIASPVDAASATAASADVPPAESTPSPNPDAPVAPAESTAEPAAPADHTETPELPG
jgi:segregation and condensation protein B